MARAKPLPAILERVDRCAFCGSEMTSSKLSRRENPFCNGCLHDRLKQAANALGPVGWRVVGDYVEFLSEGSRKPD
jgi:hypothetical protein